MMRLTLARPDAVIFDMDGLLIDSEQVVLRLFAEAAKSLDMPWEHEVGLRMVGLTSHDGNALLTEAYGDDYRLEQLRTRFDELYDAAIESGSIPVKPFARELLDRLEAQRIPCGVATSTRRARAVTKLTRVNLLKHFKSLTGGDEVLRGKPAPDIYELAAQRLGVQPTRCLALEDSNAGVRAALAANMKVVMVPDLLKPDPDIRRLGVPCVTSLKDVIAALSL